MRSARILTESVAAHLRPGGLLVFRSVYSYTELDVFTDDTGVINLLVGDGRVGDRCRAATRGT